MIWTGPGGLLRNGINLWLSSENDQRFMATRNQIQDLKDSSLRSVDGFNGMTKHKRERPINRPCQEKTWCEGKMLAREERRTENLRIQERRGVEEKEGKGKEPK